MDTGTLFNTVKQKNGARQVPVRETRAQASLRSTFEMRVHGFGMRGELHRQVVPVREHTRETHGRCRSFDLFKGVAPTRASNQAVHTRSVVVEQAPINVRRADGRNASCLKRLLHEVDAEFFPPLSARADSPIDAIPRAIEAREHEFIVAFSGYRLAGAAWVVRGPPPWHEKQSPEAIAFIKIVAVSKEFRGMKLCPLLFSETLGFLRDEGIREVHIRTWSENKKMVRVLERTGFELIGIAENDRAPGVHTLYFSKQL